MPLHHQKCEVCGLSDAEITCLTCPANLCNSCDQKWHSDKRQNHKRMEYAGTDLPSRYCARHEGQTLSLYCETCSFPICALCLIGEHKNHLVISIQDAAQKNIKVLIPTVEAVLAEMDQELKTMEKEKKKLENKLEEEKK